MLMNAAGVLYAWLTALLSHPHTARSEQAYPGRRLQNRHAV
jgi:hypothetical protein